MMFHRRSTEFDPRTSAIVGHLRAVEKELGGIGNEAGRRVSASASAAAYQIADALSPILKAIEERLRTGQRLAVDESVSLSNEAVETGARIGNDALDRIAVRLDTVH